jgi:hypothetical protein
VYGIQLFFIKLHHVCMIQKFIYKLRRIVPGAKIQIIKLGTRGERL